MESKFKVSLQLSMLSIFLSLFVITMLTIIIVTTIRLYDSMMIISNQQMTEATKLVDEQLASHIDPAERSSQLTLQLIKNGILDPNNTDQMVSYTLELLDSLEDAAMVYWGDDSGNFIISRLQPDGSISSEIIKRSGQTATSQSLTRNLNKQIISDTTQKNPEYDPRTRPWYQAAKETQQPNWSKPYLFFSGGNNVMGVTYAAPLIEKGALLGVVGIDVKLDVMSQFLAKMKIGKTGVAFIVDDKGNLIAHPQLYRLTQSGQGYKIPPISALGSGHLTTAFKTYQAKKQTTFSFEHKNKTYLAAFKLIPSFTQNNWSIVIVVPENDFIGSVKETNIITLSFSAFVLLVGMILITLFSRKISASVQKLVDETEKIKDFDLSQQSEINTYIKEISLLSQGISSMRKGLKSFRKYVPADLVRQLIREHESATLGGKKKRITIMFSDIDGFTQISEDMPPESLTRHISTYFQHLSRIINQQQGTIDKYIGDAIMAFWGSPTEDKKQVYHACTTALQIQRRLKLLNAKWQDEDKPPLPTRIGLHTGEAIVGNLGSSERLNYTAIGDTINTASRIENINKVYQTQIIVSHAVQQEAQDRFLFKLVDTIALKGHEKTTLVYELLDERGGSNEIKLQAYCELFEIAHKLYQQQKWEKAINVYHEITKEYPNDTTATTLIERCKAFQKDPPGPGWDGVWRYDKKT